MFLLLICWKYNLVFLLKKVVKDTGVSLPFGLSYSVLEGSGKEFRKLKIQRKKNKEEEKTTAIGV